MEHNHQIYYSKSMKHPYIVGYHNMKVYACKKCPKLFVEIDRVNDKVLEQK